MRANQILDGFSETLVQDERILSSGERELLVSLLQNAGSVASGSPEIQSAVIATIHRAVGETVAQRAFTLLGSRIVEQILASATPGQTAAPGALSSHPGGHQPTTGPQFQSAKRPTISEMGPKPPTPGPQPPSPGPGAKPTLKDMPLGPQIPSTSGPHGLQPFTVDARSQSEETRGDGSERVQVLEDPANTRAHCVVLDEFLAPQELDELMRFALQHEADFQISEVISARGDEIDHAYRRSRVLMDLGKHQDIILQRIRGVLPQVLRRLDLEEFSVAGFEAQITASNDGDFFKMHSDDGQEPIASRELTFVYFFHREPGRFAGGELRLHDAKPGGHFESAGTFQTILPQQNQIVFFPCSLLHEITPIECPSRSFADSRFTVNGWLHK